MCDNVREKILDSFWEMPTEILGQFPISSSFNGIVLSRFVTFHMKCLKNVRMIYTSVMIDETFYLQLEFHLNNSMRRGFNYSSDS